MQYNSPIGAEKLERILCVAELGPTSRVLDLGCGSGEMLIRCGELFGAAGVGLDHDPALIADAQRKAWDRRTNCRFEIRDLRATGFEPGDWDLVACVGSVHAIAPADEACPAALSACARLVRPGGYVLIGDGFWERPPDPAYLAFLGDPVGIYRSHAENVRLGQDFGLTPMFAVVASPDEWDVFEWSHRLRIEREADARPDHATLARRGRSRAWRDAWLTWGRGTMGFGLYMFRRPLTPDGSTPPR